MTKQTKTIEIDLDVYKALHSQIQTFEEPLNNVLRRILEIDMVEPQLLLSKTLSKPQTLAIYKPYKNILATAVVTEFGGIKVLKGSTFKRTAAPHFKGPYMELRKRLISEGILDENFTLTQHYDFKSKSAAASVILACQSNGNAWRS